jgi:hypothetical protein
MEEQKRINWNEARNKALDFFKASIKVIFILVAIASGYAISEIHHRYSEKNSQKEGAPMETRNSSEISVAINERNELMIIDRRNGEYEIYQDSTGIQIFNLYANKMYNDNK